MKTNRDLIAMALRKLGVLRSGGSPSGADAQDCLDVLQSLYAGWVSKGSFGRVRDINLSGTTTPTTAGPNQHVNVTTDTPVVVNLPSVVVYDYWDTWMPCRDYGWGLNVPLGADTGTNMPRDKSVVMVTYQTTNPYAETRASYVYDGTIQRWMRYDVLDLDDEAPLSARNADGLASCLAIACGDLFGSELLSAITQQSAASYKLALVSNFGNGEDEYGCA